MNERKQYEAMELPECFRWSDKDYGFGHVKEEKDL